MEDITDNYRYCPNDTGLKIAPLYVIILRWFLAKFHFGPMYISRIIAI